MKKALLFFFTFSSMLYSIISYGACPSIDEIRNTRFKQIILFMDRWVAYSSPEKNWLVTAVINKTDQVQNEEIARALIQNKIRVIPMLYPDASGTQKIYCVYTPYSYPLPKGEEVAVVASGFKNVGFKK